MFAYMLGGAAIGGLSGAAGAAVTAQGCVFANTSGLIFSSFSNSVGMSILSGRNTAGINFGAGNFSFASGKVDWVFGKNDVGGTIGDIFSCYSVANDITAILDLGLDGIEDTRKGVKEIRKILEEYGVDISDEQFQNKFMDGVDPLDMISKDGYSVSFDGERALKIWKKVEELYSKYPKAWASDLLKGAPPDGGKALRFGKLHLRLYDIKGTDTNVFEWHVDKFDINKSALWHGFQSLWYAKVHHQL